MPDNQDQTVQESDEWEDVEEETSAPQSGKVKGPSHDEIKELSAKSSTLFMALCSHPKFNKAAPDHSPRQLWFVADFVRRTCLEYIAPLCPSQENGPWPKFNLEKYSDALSRSQMIGGIILRKEMQFICGGPFDFGPEVRDLARFLSGDPQPEQLETLKGVLPEQVDRMRKR